MGTVRAMRQPPAARTSTATSLMRRPHRAGQLIVAFDFDGTLTVRDSFTALMRHEAGAVRWLQGLAALAPDALAYVAHRDRGRIKAAAARRFLGGLTETELAARAEAFAQAAWSDLMRPDALACWSDWGARGAHRVIVTASPAVTVAPFAHRLEADNLIGTGLALGPDGRITGALDGANCRGPEKVLRLRAAYGDALHLAAAYGDTSGDAEMLAIADQPGYRVFTERPAMRRA